MILRFIPLVQSASGKLTGLHSSTHVRTNRYGTVYTCHNPVHKRPPTPKQIAARKAFAERYAKAKRAD